MKSLGGLTEEVDYTSGRSVLISLAEIVCELAREVYILDARIATDQIYEALRDSRKLFKQFSDTSRNADSIAQLYLAGKIRPSELRKVVSHILDDLTDSVKSYLRFRTRYLDKVPNPQIFARMDAYIKWTLKVLHNIRLNSKAGVVRWNL